MKYHALLSNCESFSLILSNGIKFQIICTQKHSRLILLFYLIFLWWLVINSVDILWEVGKMERLVNLSIICIISQWRNPSIAQNSHLRAMSFQHNGINRPWSWTVLPFQLNNDHWSYHTQWLLEIHPNSHQFKII